MSYPLVVDLSSNDLGVTDPAELLANGVVAAILSPFSRGDPPHDMAALADLCLRKGLPILAWYGLPYFGDRYGESRDLAWCVDLSKQYPPTSGLIFADCESDANEVGWTNAPTPTPAQRLAALVEQRGRVESGGRKLGIYAGASWWQERMANSAMFGACPWWLPWYAAGGNPHPPIVPDADGRTSLLPFRPVLIGHQFTSLWGQQPPYSSTNPRAGRAERDMSYWYGPIEQEDELSADEKALLAAMARALTGLDGAAAAARLDQWNRPRDVDGDGTNDPTGNSLLDGYQDHATRIAQLEQRPVLAAGTKLIVAEE